MISMWETVSAASSVGDVTGHGNPLSPGPGSNNVLIGGRRAWRGLIDTHVCPLVDGLKPHVGGVVLEGSKSVFINNYPAIRIGDKITESGLTNFIVSGNTSVIIR